MASKNIVAMMVEKGAPFTVEQLEGMQDNECWKWIYTHYPPKTRRKTSMKPEICFTGFRPEDRANLEKLAEENGYRIVGSVTVKLKVLVTGEAPGPSKLEKAGQQGVDILTRDDFIDKVATKQK